MFLKIKLTAVTLAAVVSLGAIGPAVALPVTVSASGLGINVDQLVVLDNVSPANRILTFSTFSGGSVNFVPPTNSLTMNLAGGVANSLTVASLPGSFTGSDFFMNGNTGDDDFIINALFSGLFTVAGAGGTNTLDVSGLGLSLIDTGSTILNGGNVIVSYSGINFVIGASRIAIAEPGALALLGLGLAGLGFVRRRKTA